MSSNKKQIPENNSRRRFLKNSAAILAGFIIVPRYVLGGSSPNGLKYIAPSDRINLGFIGCGKQGRILSNYFLKTGEINIAAISEVYSAKAELMLGTIKTELEQNNLLYNTNTIGVYPDYRELLLRKDIDAVVIATPDHWHAAMAVRAAEAGKDIYCEKPLALTIKEGRAMVNAARKHNRVFQTGSMQRSWPEFRQAVEIIRNGFIGEIKSVKVNVGPPPVAYNLPEQPVPEGLDWKKWLGPNEFKHFNEELAPPTSRNNYPNWRNYKEFGGGMVTDWGAHMFDIAQWALGMDNSGPVKIYPPDADHPFLTYEYKNGVTMTHEKWEWNNAVLFTGTEGEVRIGRGKLETTPASVKSIVIGDAHKRVYNSENHYKDFFNAMRNRSRPICDVEIGHRTSSVCILGNIAYEVKRPLIWNPKKEEFKNDAAANALLGRPMLNEWGIKL